MGIAQPLADHDAVAVMRFHGEGKQAARSKHAPRMLQHGNEIGDVDHRNRRQGSGRRCRSNLPRKPSSMSVTSSSA